MSNNNISPDRMLESGSPDLSRYPWYLYDDWPGRTTSRGIRAIEVLSRAYHVTVAGALELALDDKLPGLERWQEALRRALNAEPGRIRGADAEQRRFLDRLLRFDGRTRKESMEALAFFYWWTAMVRDTAGFRMLREGIERGAPSPTAGATLIAAADSARQALRRRHGTIDVRYGDEFRAGRGGVSLPAGSGGLPTPGFYDQVVPLKVTSYSAIDSTKKRWSVGGGYHTTLTIFTDPIQSFSLAPLGQSSDPKSPHYSDLAVFLSERRLKSTLFNKEELLREKVTTTTLEIPRPGR
jgi:acyl-homoserine lactone acylase PvdQ